MSKIVKVKASQQTMLQALRKVDDSLSQKDSIKSVRWANTNATTQKIDKELAWFDGDVIERVRSVNYGIVDELVYELEYGNGKSVVSTIKKLDGWADDNFYKELLKHAQSLARAGF